MGSQRWQIVFWNRQKLFLAEKCLILLQRLCQLIRAGSWAEAALDAFDAGDCLVNIHAIDQAGNALCVAGAAPTNCTFFTLLSSTSKLISREQTPFVLYVMVKPPQMVCVLICCGGNPPQ